MTVWLPLVLSIVALMLACFCFGFAYGVRTTSRRYQRALAPLGAFFAKPEGEA
jgi:hypothetical protein